MPFMKKNRVCRPFNGSEFFKPRGIPLSELEVTLLDLDELEAFHLVDYEDLEQSQAAEKMKISTSTLQRLLYSGRKKIADALYSSKALEIKISDDVLIRDEHTENYSCCRKNRHGNKQGRIKC